jgi:hypothetical protein
MRFQSYLAFALLLLLMGGCAQRNKQDAVDAQCPKLIAQAQDLYGKLAKSRDKRATDQAANLITGAKIALEHREYIQCIDKSSRAIKLLDPNAVPSIRYYN